MNNIDYEIADPDPAGTVASLSSLDVPAEFDADWIVDIREPTVVLTVPIRGHLDGIGVAAFRLAQGTLRHREGTTARTRGADFLFVCTVTGASRQLTCSDEPGAPARATGARGGADSSAPGAEA